MLGMRPRPARWISLRTTGPRICLDFRTYHPLRFGIDSGAPWDAHIALLHPDDREESRKAWLTCLNTGAAAEFSQRVLNADGGYRWLP